MSSRITGIGQIAVTVSDVDAALAFYRDILELPFLFRPAVNLAFLDAGGIRLKHRMPGIPSLTGRFAVGWLWSGLADCR